MVKNHRFLPNLSGDIMLWRYMSFEKFIWMIFTHKLYMASIDSFDDKREGTPTLLDREFLPFLTKCDLEREKKRTFANCWIISNHELSLMWQSYAPDGIAISTTADKLIESLNDDTDHDLYFCGVNYVDEHESSFQPGERLNMLKLLLTKRSYFEQEKEARLLYCDSSNADVKKHVDIPVNLNMLIDQVVVSPGSAEERVLYIKNLIAQLTGNQINVVKSSLN